MDNRNSLTPPSQRPNMATGLVRGVFLSLLIYVIAFLLGSDFFFMVVGLRMIMRSMMPYWLPARRLTEALWGMPQSQPSVLLSLTWSKTAILFIPMCFAMFIIIFGAYHLVHDGWCIQNMFCASAIQYSP
jgi:hypothetical protein